MLTKYYEESHLIFIVLLVIVENIKIPLPYTVINKILSIKHQGNSMRNLM